jgi:hypothetical protein
LEGINIVRITGVAPITPRDLKPVRSVRGQFTVPDSDAAPTSTGALQALTSVDMLLAIASVDDEAERRRQKAAYAAAGLDKLEALDQAENEEERRRQAVDLAEWTQGVTRPDDSDLCRILRQIELRALVEIAKIERSA